MADIDEAVLLRCLIRRAHPMSIGGASLFNPEGEIAAAHIRALRAEIELLKEAITDPNILHINMLRGTVAKLSWAQCKHLWPAEIEGEIAAEREACLLAVRMSAWKRHCVANAPSATACLAPHSATVSMAGGERE